MNIVRLRIIIALIVGLLVTGPAIAQVPTSFHADQVGPPGEVPDAVAAVLLDQPISTVNQNAYADQDFEATYDQYDIFIADDFTVPASGWTITTLYFDNNTWNSGCDLTCATVLHVQVYADAGGVPDGDPSGGGNPPLWSLAVAPTDAQVTLTTGTGGYQTNVLFDLTTPFFLPAGTYWITYYPEMPLAGCCQHGRQPSDTTNGADAVVINPGGAFGFPPTWTPVTSDATWSLAQQDFAMRIEGIAGGLEADLSLTKTAAPATVYPGEQVVYSLDAANAGPVDATNVTVADTLPAGVAYVSDTCGGVWDGGTGVWTWTIGNLATGGSTTCDLTVSVTTAAPGTISNTAAIAGTEADPDPSNNTATADFAVLALADVSIVKTSGAVGPVNPGDQVVFTLAVDNAGPSSATGVVVTDAIPTDLAYVADTCGGSYDAGTGVWTWSIGTLASGANTTCDLTVQVAPAPTGTLTNVASVGASTDDPDTGNNTSSADVTVEAVADLAITKASGAVGPVDPGSHVVYTLGVTNAGPSDATGVTVTDTIPADLAYVSDTCGGSYDAGSGTWTWTIGSLIAGDSVTCDLTLQVDPEISEGTVVNTASVAGNETDPDGANSTASASIEVAAALPIPVLSRSGGALMLLLLSGAALILLRRRA